MNEIFYIHSPNYPIDSTTSLENMLSGICDLDEVSRVTVIRTDGKADLPSGLKQFQDHSSKECICIKANQIDPSRWTGEESNDLLWADNLETLIVNCNLNQESTRRIFLLSTGNGWHSALIYYMFEIIEGELWVRGFEGTATRLDREKVDSTASEILAEIGNYILKNPGSFPTARELQGNESVPSAKGIENSLRAYSHLFDDKKSDFLQRKQELENQLKEGREEEAILRELSEIKRAQAEEKLYEPTELGKYNCHLQYAKRMRNSSDKQQKGLIYLIRSNYNIDDVKEYLREHKTTYDKFTFISQGIGKAREENANVFFEEIIGLLGDRAVFINSDFEVNIDSSLDSGKILTSSTNLIRILQSIREADRSISWSLDITKCLALLRPATLQYCHLCSIPMIYFTRVYSHDGSVHESGLSQDMHVLHIPTYEQIESILKIIDSPNLEYAQFIISIFDFSKEKPFPGKSLTVTTKKKQDWMDLYEFNQSFYATDDYRRMKEKSDTAAYKQMKRHRDKAEDDQVISGDDAAMNMSPTGGVVACILKSTLRVN